VPHQGCGGRIDDMKVPWVMKKLLDSDKKVNDTSQEPPVK
jgi:hypothetical protein